MTRLGVFHICIVMVTIIVTCYAREITKECKRINQCQCEIEGEGIIDLAPLDSGTKDHAFFQDVEAINTTDRYSWNPCTPFCEVHCEGAAVVKTSGGKVEEIGLASTEYFFKGSGVIGPYQDHSLYIWYGSSGGKSYSYVKLYCDNVDPIFKVWKSEPGFINKYYFSLTSRHCCPMPPEPPKTYTGIIIVGTIGTIGTIISAVYIGATAIRAYRGYTGWFALPFCGTCQNASKTRELYYTCGMHDTTQFLNGYVYEGNWNISIDGLVVVYNWTQFRNERVSIIKLNCDEDVDHDFQAYGEYFGHGTLHYFFNLTSKHACPTKSNITGDIPSNITNPSYCPKPWLNETTTTTSTTEITSSSSTSTTMTTTTTQPPFFPFSFLTGLNLALVIITGLAVIFIFYCIIGLTVNLLRGRRGSRVVPNYRFWQCLFLRLTCYCCRCKPEADTNPLIHD